MKLIRHAAGDTWTPPWEYREICACQRHGRQERALWRRALRGAKRRGVALLVTVPLAFGAIGMEAMNVSIPALAQHAIDMSTASRPFPTFIANNVPEALNPDPNVESLSLDTAREEFFRTQVPYGAIIYREAVRNGLAPELVAAVVESESDFRPRLVSKRAHAA